MSADEEWEKQRRIQQWERASIPDWTQRFMDPARGIIDDIASTALPPDAVSTWETALAKGLIVDSDDLKWRGRGLWIMGSSRRANLLAAALLQRHILSGTVKTGCYLGEDEWLESESPDVEQRRAFPLEAELLVLSGAGEAYRAASGWADATVRRLLRRREHAGLPTLVTSSLKPQDALQLSEFFLQDTFYVVRLGDDAGR